tara:strand:- start:395 stop:529 length:135 start_codon:yes stop_codon:yes gene_type:complete
MDQIEMQEVLVQEEAEKDHLVHLQINAEHHQKEVVVYVLQQLDQ